MRLLEWCVIRVGVCTVLSPYQLIWELRLAATEIATVQSVLKSFGQLKIRFVLLILRKFHWLKGLRRLIGGVWEFLVSEIITQK